MYTCIDKTMQIVLERGSIDGMPNTYACKGVSNPNVPIFPRGFALYCFSFYSCNLCTQIVSVCVLVYNCRYYIMVHRDIYGMGHKKVPVFC